MAAFSLSRLSSKRVAVFAHFSGCRICHRNIGGLARLTNGEVRQKRAAMFEAEKARQLGLVRRVEKIKVEVLGPPEDCTLVMNKHLSTPYNCAMHTEEFILRRSALALVNGELWDMHRPLVTDCQLQFLHFKDEDPRALNEVFMRSCSLVLGDVLDRAFNDRCSIDLVSFPPPSVKSGSFVYDVDLQLPTAESKLGQFELGVMSRIGGALQSADLPFERLEVDASVAALMFDDNAYKSSQIPAIAAKSPTGSSVTLYRLGDHVDISRGPMISSTSHISRFTVTAVHEVTGRDCGRLHRFQGLALPAPLKLHYWTYQLLTKRARHLNRASLPSITSSRPSSPTAAISDI